MNPAGHSRRNLAICIAVLIASTLLTYWPVLKNGFINYDDPDYVTTNEVVQKGLTTEGFKWAFTTGHASNWHPITWLSHMADVSMFGMNPMGHHAINLFFHVANSVLLLLLLRMMTGSVWRSAMVAALFALHPLHVESVAWVAERKDVLSAFFGILTLMAYTSYATGVSLWSAVTCHRFGTGRHVSQSESAVLPAQSKAVCYWLSLVFFALGLMSKPMLVTWPFVMLLLDFWPLGRVGLEDGGWKMEGGKTKTKATPLPTLGTPSPPAPLPIGLGEGGVGPTEAERAKHRVLRLLLEKIPFFALALISCLVTVKVQQGAMSNSELITLSDRGCNAVVAYATYLQQTLWPVNLAMFYPFPASVSTQTLMVPLAVLVALSVLCVRLARNHPFLTVGWCWFLGTLVPVIGILQVGAQAHADRYTYLPLIGIFFALIWGLSAFVKPQRKQVLLVTVCIIATLSVLAKLSHDQVGHWKNDRALCTHAAQVTDENYVALGGIAIDDIKHENWSGAMTNLMRAYDYAKPRHTERSVSYYIGVALQMQGKPKEALPYLETCVVSAEMQPERNHRLGLSLMDAGRMDEAEAAIKLALAAKPQSLDYNLGMAAFLVTKGDTKRAEPIYASMVTNHPAEPAAQKAYGDFLALVNRHAEAEPRYATAVKLKPDSAAYHKAYASSLQHNGHLDLAADQFEKAFAILKPSAQELLDLADIYAQIGKPRQVLACYEKAIGRDANDIPALNNLAWFLATCPEDGVRNGTRAVELAERACKITEWKVTVLMGTLAAAYAEAGRFPDAIAMAEKAIAKARDEKQDDVAKRNGELLELYRSGKAYREK